MRAYTGRKSALRLQVLIHSFSYGVLIRTAETLVDKAMALDHVGGVFGGNYKPSKFLCLVLKMLQIQPDKDIVVEFIKNEDFKYVRAIGALYMRLVGSSIDCYKVNHF
jgi:pre-mRNA-splicing factor 38A